MKKPIILFFTSLILGCSSNDNSTNNETNLKLVKEIITYPNSSTTRNYIYQNNVLSKITGNDDNSEADDQTFIFSNSKLSKIKFYIRQNAEDPAKPTTLVMSYKGEDIESYTSSFDDSSNPVTTYTNTYINGRLDFQITNNGNKGFRHEYYTNGNLYKIKNNGSDLFTYNSYDNKKNPYYLVYPAPYLRMQIYSPNNVLNIIGNNYTETYEYEYNNYDYPTKIIKRVNGTIQSTTTFKYNLN